jgi:hypothetical protein
VPDRIELRTVPKDEFGQPLTLLEARIRTTEFQPQDNAAVNVSMTLPDGSTVVQSAEPSLREAGLYETTFASRVTGRYRVNVEVADDDGKSLGKSQTGWVADPAAEEFQRVAPNTELLESLSKQTGGEVVDVNDLESFVRSLPTRQAPLTETYTTPLWHQPWILCLIVVCLCGEWGLRRWKGLP